MRIPALLTLNPELQRNLWLELSPTRMIAMPVALAVLLGGFELIGGAHAAVSATRFVIAALLLFWGSRLAADGFGEEVTSRTWDNQRLSAASAWSMTLGKLVGGTSYAWYGALLCAPVLIAFGDEVAPNHLLSAMVAGMLAQSVALLVVLVLHGFSPGSRRGQTTIAQLVGFGFGLTALNLNTPTTGAMSQVIWYGGEWDRIDFQLVHSALLVLWLVFGIMRSIRRGFGHADGPLGWMLFTLYEVFFYAGFYANFATDLPGFTLYAVARFAIGWLLSPVYSALAIAVLVAAALTYCGLLVTPASPIGLRRLDAAFRERSWLEVWRNLPMWAPSAGIAAFCVTVLSSLSFTSASIAPEPLLLIAGLGFLVRDIAIVYFVRLTWKRRTLLALVILFSLLYGILPSLFRNPDLALARELFLPIPTGWTAGIQTGIGFGAVLPWIEAAIVLGALWRRVPVIPV